MTTTTPPTPTDLLTPAQVAELRQVSRVTVYAWIRAGLPASKFGSSWLVKGRDAVEWQPGPVGYPKGRPRSVSQNTA